MPKRWFISICWLLGGGLLLTACRADARHSSATKLPTPCEISFLPQRGDGRIDQAIVCLQREAQRGALADAKLEQLGWKFIEKARLSYDSGYYKLAEQCALCLEERRARQTDKPKAEATSAQTTNTALNNADALLLRGHALHNLHRFGEAETLARQLIQRRGLAFDYGLLGDVLLEQGKLAEAIAAYQKMMDLKPGPQAYSRAAHVRWLRGDLSGAVELMRLAAAAADQRDAGAAAWALAKQALFEMQAGATARARRRSTPRKRCCPTTHRRCWRAGVCCWLGDGAATPSRRSNAPRNSAPRPKPSGGWPRRCARLAARTRRASPKRN